MIKWIKSLIKKVFGKKEEPIILEDEEEYLAEEKSLADYAESFKETVEPEKIQCNTHSRFKKSCPICIEAAK